MDAPGTVDDQPKEDDIDTPHPPGVPPRLTNGNSQCHLIKHCTAGSANTTQHQLVLASLHAGKADVLLSRRSAPLSFINLILIDDVRLVAQVDSLEKQVEGTLTIRQIQFLLGQLLVNMILEGVAVVSLAADT